LAFFWIVRSLKRERLKIKELLGELGSKLEDLGVKTDTFGQLAKAAREAAEVAGSSAPGGSISLGSTNWELIRQQWQEVRDRIELLVDRVQHHASRAKYSKISRYSYEDLISELRKDEWIKSAPAYAALISMNAMFLKLRLRPSNVTNAEVAQFRLLLKDVNGCLPKLPKIGTALAPVLQAAE
jgi:hypothetical protein